MGWSILPAKTWVFIVLYMIVVYTVVGVFQATMRDESTYDMSDSIPQSVLVLGGTDNGLDNDNFILGIIDAFATFWGILLSFFVMVFSIFTFNISNPVGIPVELLWIPWLLVIPVYIVAMVGLVPFVIELFKSTLEYFKIL